MYSNRIPAKFYKRNVDISLLFKLKSHRNKFLKNLNTQHLSIRFTSESAYNNQILSLESLIAKDSSLHTAVYRKSTFIGRGMKFLSNKPQKYKIYCIFTL